MMLALDYTRWGNARHVWNSTADLLAAPSIADGVHSIQAEGLPLDVLMVNGACLGKATQTVLPVFFSGAVSNRGGKPGPFFSGSGIAESKGIAAICIADPTLALDPDLELAWYAGSSRQQTQTCVLELLAGLADKFQIELLLVGGSGAGFAALQFGGKLRERASVLVWNPQTDLLGYYRGAVQGYLSVCFPGVEWPEKEPAASFKDSLARYGACSSIIDAYSAGSAPRRLLYLQNSCDAFHVRRHAGPLLSRLDISCVAPDAYESIMGNMLFWFGRWGQGHDPIPKPVLIRLLEMMLDPAMKPTAMLQWLRSQEASESRNAGSIPLSFRHLDPTQAHLVVSAVIEGDKLHVSSSFPNLPGGRDAPSFAYYVYAGKTRIQTRWYEADATAEFPLLPGQAPTRITAFAIDSFGEKVHAGMMVETRVAANPTGPIADRRTRVLVVGSCVSRDAFALVAPSSLCLTKYIARSSLASGMHDIAAGRELLRGLAAIESPWQRRMVEFDLTRQLPRALAATGSYDIVLLDLIDERFPLAVIGGVPVTVSGEFLRTGHAVAPADLLPYDSPPRMQLWMEGAARFMATVDPARVILNEVNWATHASDGMALEGQSTIGAHNRILASMYEHLKARYSIRSISYPSELLTADPGHRWGRSPFHYVSALYVHTINELSRMTGASPV